VTQDGGSDDECSNQSLGGEEERGKGNGGDKQEEN
jgi:hypothetical protein